MRNPHRSWARNRRFLVGLILLFVVSWVVIPTAWAQAAETKPASDPKGPSDPDLARFLQVYQYVKEFYVDKVDGDKLATGAIKGLLGTLDPYTEYFEPEELQSFTTNLEGKFGGIGVQITRADKGIAIEAVFPNSPAEKAGLKVGDRIISADGKDITGMAVSKAAEIIRGEPGTQVILSVQRDGAPEPLLFSITREEINLNSVSTKVLEDGVGYIRLATFAEGSGKDVAEAVKSLKQKGSRGIILDLRDNPGGLLSEAVAVGGAFIPKGPIVYIVERDGKRQAFNSESGVGPIPLVVLVNSQSASASEIVAGAIQDTGAGVLVGTHTFGKGLVQTIVQLPSGQALKLTIAKYITPVGRSILPGKGLTPDVIVEAETPVVPPPITVKRELKVSGIGLDVLAVQERLKARGFDPGPADGIYGERTAAAVGEFQRSRGLPATGAVDAATVDALNKPREEKPRDVQLAKAIETLKARMAPR